MYMCVFLLLYLFYLIFIVFVVQCYYAHSNFSIVMIKSLHCLLLHYHYCISLNSCPFMYDRVSPYQAFVIT